VTRSEPAKALDLGSRIKRVAIASALAQALGEIITLVQTVVVARLLSPAEVGIFTAGTVLTAFLAEFSEGGLRAALINREKDVEEAAETVFWATLAAGVVMSLGALAAAPVIGAIFDDSLAGLIAAISSGGLVIYSLCNVPEAYLQRAFSVQRRLIVGPSVAAAFAIVTITLAVLGCGVWSLVAGTYASYVTLTGLVWILAGWRPGRVKGSVALWREMARYGFPLIIQSIVIKARQLTEQIVVGRALDTTTLGQYRYGYRISRIPVMAMIEIVAYALFPAFSRLAQAGRIKGAFVRACAAITFAAAPVSFLLLAVGEQMVVIVLGDPWRMAGWFVVATAGLGLGQAFSMVSQEAVKGVSRTSLINQLTVLELVLGIGLLVLVIPFGLVGVGIAVSATALVVGVRFLQVARRELGVPVGELLRAVVPPVVAAGIAAAATHELETLVLLSDTRPTLLGVAFLVVDGLAFVAVYIGLLAAFNRRGLLDLVGMVRRSARPAPAETSTADVTELAPPDGPDAAPRA
jgi:O-antigen/teichoic acid export membrane protein